MKDVSFITDYVGIPTFYNAPQIKLDDVKEGMAVVGRRAHRHGNPVHAARDTVRAEEHP